MISSVRLARRILIVDDHGEISEPLGRGLREEGFEVDACETQAEAIARFSNDAYDLVVIDLKNPRPNSFELIRHLKAIERKTSMPRSKICLSALFEIQKEEFELLFPLVDVSFFLDKSSSPKSMVERIRNELDGS